MIKPISLKKSDIARSFSAAAKEYDKHAFIQKEVGNRLLSRLDLIKKKPSLVLDVGAGTGSLTYQLQKKFPHSKIIGLDLANGMMSYAKSKLPWQIFKNKPHYLCADMESLPFPNHSFDLIFSNLTLQWCLDLHRVFNEFKRVLKPNGMLFFSTLGPQTLYELRQSFAKADNFPHVNDFIDMHEYGDLLLQSELQSPVIDMEMITVTYQNVKELFRDLKATGAKNMALARAKGLTSKNKFSKMISAYNGFKFHNGLYPATFEVVYGHAYREERLTHSQGKDGVVRIPGNKIPKLMI